MELLGDASGQDVALLALNIVQAIVLAWIGQQQRLSSQERSRRSDADDCERSGPT